MRSGLEELANRWGVATRYIDGTGVERTPSEVTVEAVLEALGAFEPDADPRWATAPETDTAPQCSAGVLPPRAWGVFTPLSALRASDAPDWGVGHLGLLDELGQVVADRGASVVSTLPLCATHHDQASPYSAISRQFFDERWVDPHWVAELLGVRSHLAAFPPGRPDGLADPQGAHHWVRTQLEALHAQVGMAPLVQQWRSVHPAVEQYARWKAARPDGANSETEVFIQWAVQAQLAQVSASLAGRDQHLYLDFPVGVVPDGFDVWANPDEFVPNVSVGVPPDKFFPNGQNWGLAPMHPQRCSHGGHRLFRDQLAAHMAHAGLLRIDHVMGLHRQFWIPANGDGTGTYVSMPHHELWSAVAELSNEYHCGIVGEDLGTVPDLVRETMRARNVAGFYLAQDEIRAPFRLGRPVPQRCVASLNTHDLEPVCAWWAGGEPAERVRDHLVGELASSGADVVMVSDSDLTADRRRFNTPGEVDETTWRYRSLMSIEDLRNRRGVGTDAARVLDNVATWRSTPGGSTPSGWRSPLDQQDIESFEAGTHGFVADRFGVHPAVVAGVCGSWASVWAPRATEVAIAGDFNGFARFALDSSDSGWWSGFVPSAMVGDYYKFNVRGRDGRWVEKADPLARTAEPAPSNASKITHDDLDYQWNDTGWMGNRSRRLPPDAPMSIYEIHLGAWQTGDAGAALNYREIANRLVAYVSDMGFTHVELMPVMEHPFGGSWGYHVSGFFAPTSRYGTPEDFAAFVDVCHQHDIGVIVDWVPAHFPTDEFGLARFDGEPLYEYTDPLLGEHPEWGSYVFDFGRGEVRSFLVSSARWWVERFHLDGLRVDAVASMLYRSYGRDEGQWSPNADGGPENFEAVALIRQVNHEVHHHHPDVLMIAEESTSWPGVTRPVSEGGLGFDLKWDLGWMHDTLDYLSTDPIYRRWRHEDITFRQMYATSERFVLPLSHDEVVHGKASLAYKMAGDRWQQLANLRLLFGYQYFAGGIPLIFMGGEFAQSTEWDHNRQLPWELLHFDEHRGVRAWVASLNELLTSRPAMFERSFEPEGFEWLHCDDREQSVFAWVRRARTVTQEMFVVAGFTPVPREHYQISVPGPGRWRCIANSDSSQFGGSDYPIVPVVSAQAAPDGTPQWSATLTVPPLGVLVYELESA